MNAATRKLKEKSGISLAIALVFFLLCAMVGTVVLSAAASSAGSTARERQLYRETLALTSAADLLSHDIQDMTFTGSYTRTETVTTTSPENPDNPNEKTTVETKVTYGAVTDGTSPKFPKFENSELFEVRTGIDGSVTDDLNLWPMYLGNQAKLKNPETAVSLLTPVEISFGAVENQNIPAVEGTVTVANDYTITVVLKSGDNALTMTFPPNVTVETEVKTDPTETKDAEGKVSVKTTVTTYTTTIKWKQPTMREGGTIHEQTP